LSEHSFSKQISYKLTTANLAMEIHNSVAHSSRTSSKCYSCTVIISPSAHIATPQTSASLVCLRLHHTAYGDLRSFAASTSLAAAISGLSISLFPNIRTLDPFSEPLNGFFNASLSFSVVVLWSDVSSSSSLIDLEVELDAFAAIGSVGGLVSMVTEYRFGWCKMLLGGYR
jgi:hypothetical protein